MRLARNKKVFRWATLPAGLLLAWSGRAQVTPAQMEQLKEKLPAASQGAIDFQRQISPILENSCLRCHGPEKPKGNFRLDSPVAAMKGGENGTAIVPGASEKSPLIYYVAHLVEDMEMPPAGKGDRLTSEQIGLLRAWIDQGAKWPESAYEFKKKVVFSVTPSLQYVSVKGDEAKFREHTGQHEGFTEGIHFTLEEQLSDKTRFSADGHVFYPTQDYRLRLAGEQKDLGFVRFGWEQYREYYDDTGGYAPFLTPSNFSLGRDLELDIGRAWFDVGLTLPDWPRLVFGYELQYREGDKSILQWGDVGTLDPDLGGADSKLIYPASKAIDEQVHIIKFDLAHETSGVGIENNFRTEFYANENTRELTEFYDLGGGGQDRFVKIKEDNDHFQASDALRLEKQVNDWLFLSGGYFYSKFNGEFTFAQETVSPNNFFLGGEYFYKADRILFDQDTHIFNANTQLGPWSGLTLYGGAQNEWMTQRGFGSANLDEGDPAFLVTYPAQLYSDIDRATVDEYVGAKYTKIPFTVLFVEGRLQQESLDHYENQSAGTHAFLRDTDGSSEMGQFKGGFTISPDPRVSLTAQYRRRDKETAYDHIRGETPFGPLLGYSTFIRSRELETEEVDIRLSVRPVRWLKSTLSYQKVATDYWTSTEPVSFPPPFNLVFSEGGKLLAGNYDADIASINVSLTPWQRLYLSSTLSYRGSRTSSHANGHPTVVAYDGEMYSSLSSATYILNNKTDLLASYAYSWADYGQDNSATGLPLGLVYDWHVSTVGVSRKFRKNISTNLQYRFYYYDEENMGGSNNYQAHAVIASMSMTIN